MSSSKLGESSSQEMAVFERRVADLGTEYALQQAALAEEQTALQAAETDCHVAEQGTAALIDIAEAMQNQMHSRVADIVTRCLHAVFDESYGFSILVEKKRGKAEARLLLTHHDQPVEPLEAESGGVIDVAAFGLRLAALLLSRPRLRRLLVLDEPFRFLAKRNLPKLAVLVETLAEEMGVQVVMVTHERELQLGEVVEL